MVELDKLHWRGEMHQIPFLIQKLMHARARVSLLSVPTCPNHTFVSLHNRGRTACSGESARDFNTQETTHPDLQPALGGPEQAGGQTRPQRCLLTPAMLWVTLTWKILEQEESTIRLWGPRPFQSSAPRGRPVLLPTHRSGASPPVPAEGLSEPAPLQVPQFQHRTQAGTGKRCGSNHMDTSRNQSSGIPRVYWVQVCCPDAAPEPSETRLCVCEQRSAPAATEQPRQLICKLHLRTLKYFSIWFFPLTESRVPLKAHLIKIMQCKWTWIRKIRLMEVARSL